jgi:hypothetical protein
MAIVQIVSMSVVHDRHVSAPVAVLMRMFIVHCMFHGAPSVNVQVG